MRYAAYLLGVVIIGEVLVVGLLLRDSHVRSPKEANAASLAALQDSLERVQAELATARESLPGLGDYMSTIQLHAGKLWFAAKASDWELAEYELDEMKETMEAAKGLNAEKTESKLQVFSILSCRLRLPSWPNP